MSTLDFPIAFPNQTASDDLATARLMLSAVINCTERGDALNSSTVQNLCAVLSEVGVKLEVIQLFLDDCECPDIDAEYQAARRSWTRQHAGKAVAS